MPVVSCLFPESHSFVTSLRSFAEDGTSSKSSNPSRVLFVFSLLHSTKQLCFPLYYSGDLGPASPPQIGSPLLYNSFLSGVVLSDALGTLLHSSTASASPEVSRIPLAFDLSVSPALLPSEPPAALICVMEKEIHKGPNEIVQGAFSSWGMSRQGPSLASRAVS